MAATPLSCPLAAAPRLRLIASHLSRSRARSPATPAPARAFSSSLRRKLADPEPNWSFTTAASFRGKPGSPVYTPAGSGGPPAAPPAAKRRRAPLRLRQGLAADHPLAAWRDEQLARCPWGAGHDWFFVEGLPSRREGGEVRGGGAVGGGAAEEGGAETVEGTGGVVMGVADGVGGWEDSGVDPSHFAQALMWFARERVRTGRALNAAGGPSGQGLKELLEGAYEDVLAEEGIVAGSSTACLVALDAETGKLHAANLGDSSFLILRPTRSKPLPTPPASPSSSASSSSSDATTPPPVLYKLLHAQPPQIHFFNAPRQLAKLPPSSSSEGALVDSPRDADTTPPEGIQLEEGDVVIVATDGFGDNVFAEGELEQLVALVRGKADESVAPGGDHAQADQAHLLAASVAQTAVNFARLVSFKEDKVTPFEVEARRWGYRDLKGGKVDDVTVVVAVVARR